MAAKVRPRCYSFRRAFKLCTSKSDVISGSHLNYSHHELKDNTINEYNSIVCSLQSTFPNKRAFKSVHDRLIACNGDCGSQLSLLIDYCVHNKVMLFLWYTVMTLK